MISQLSRIAGSTITHVLFAFVVMGSWALFSNFQHPMPKPLIAAVVQGTLSACITLVMKRALERISAKSKGVNALWLPPIFVCSCSLAVLGFIHTMAGTPELFKTIALPFAVAAIYAIFYNLTLYRLKEKS